MEFSIDFRPINLGKSSRYVSDILGRNNLGLRDLENARKFLGINFDACLLEKISNSSISCVLFEYCPIFSVEKTEAEARRLCCFDYTNKVLVDIDFSDVANDFKLSSFFFEIIYVAEKYKKTDLIISVRVDAKIKEDFIYNKWLELGFPSTLFVKRDGTLAAE